MVDSTQPIAPRLNAMQLAWLQEIGIDRRSLPRHVIRVDSKKTTAGRKGLAPEQIASDISQTDTQPAAAVDALTPARQSPAAGLASAAPMTKAGQHTDSKAGRHTDAKAGQPTDAWKALLPAGAQARPRSGAAAASASALIQQHVEPLPQDLAALKARVITCGQCQLSASRSHAVFGEGVMESPSWMIIGEAPGDQDDRVGRPFQGNAGLLLHAMLTAIGIGPRASVFFTNLVKCRPLGNRSPGAQEVAACLPYLQRQIALVAPARILVLGRLAAQTLLNDDSGFEQLRGRVHVFNSESGAQIPLVATYHPASLLLRPQHKADAWRDLNLARSIAPT